MPKTARHRRKDRVKWVNYPVNMSAITRPLNPNASHLRPFDVGKDLNAVANLVETCFADTLDEDGRRYVNHMHNAARNPRYLRWAMAVAENVPMPFSGYVWEENGYLAGNLSLIPYKNLPYEPTELPSRGKKGAYDDEKALEKRTWVPEVY